MATLSAAVLCSVVALLLWIPVGFLIARRLPLARDLRMAAAPVLGWAVQNVAALYLAMLGGFTAVTILAATALVAFAALLIPASRPGELPSPALPLWIFAAAALVAAGPAAAVLPKISAAGVALADPIYDHVKIALVDEIVRTGVPPANPFIGSGEGPGHVAYYYYWLFGAAQLAMVTAASGWEADAAATWFAAFASLMLMCGLAFRLSRGALERRRPAAVGLTIPRDASRVPAAAGGATLQGAASAAFVLAAACGGSLRPVLTALFGQSVDAVLEQQSGLAGWFFQTTWSPHHVAAAAAVVLALLLMERLARAPSAAATLVLGVLAAAAFGSSLWVGGITFVLCAGAAAIVLTVQAKPDGRPPFVASLALAGCVAVALAAPLLIAQFHAIAERGGGAPVLIAAAPVLSPAIPDGVRRVLDVPAYWLVLLPIEFPAVWILGALAVLRLKSVLPAALPAAAFASLCGGWLLLSTAGDNNDLGWRAVLPGVMILTAWAGAWFAQGLMQGLAQRRAIAIAAAVLLGLALPDGLGLARQNFAGRLSEDGAGFGDAPALWAAVRRHTAPGERIASNPDLMDDLTPWPINLSWALLADRRSCFAGEELALAFSTLTPDARARAVALFERVFDGTPEAGDLGALVRDFGCTVAVLTPQDEAWSRDPFAASPLFTRVEEARGWRIYRRRPPAGGRD
jgi:hypothetical protein